MYTQEEDLALHSDLTGPRGPNRRQTSKTRRHGLILRLRSARAWRCLIVAITVLSILGFAAPVATANAFVTIEVRPGDNLAALVRANPTNTRFLIKAGLHRQQSVAPKDGNVFIGEPGAVLNGSRRLTGFTREGPYWTKLGQTQQAPSGGVCTQGYTGCRYPEDVFINNVMLRQVTARSELQPGTWFFDYAADKIFLADSPAGKHIETSVSRYAFFGFGSRVTIQDLTIEKYATTNHAGAIQANGHDWTIRNNEIRLNHSSGIRTGGDRAMVVGNYVHHNGKYGVGAWSGTDSQFRDNEIARNNINDFAQDWDAGGSKFSKTTRLIVRNNHVHDNRGTGLWLDIDNLNATVDRNTVVRNERNGISFEVSYNATIRSNTVDRNGNYGIFVAHSPNVNVLGNVVRHNGAGSIYAIYNPSRGSGAHGPHRLHNLDVRNNTIEMPVGRIGVRSLSTNDRVFTHWGNTFNHNSFTLGAEPRQFAWKGTLMTRAQWQAQGNDVNSRFPG